MVSVLSKAVSIVVFKEDGVVIIDFNLGEVRVRRTFLVGGVK